MPASSASSASGSSSSSRISLAISAFSESRWVLTETYSPTAMLIAPAASPARPAVSTAPRSVVAAGDADDQAGGRDDAVVGAEHPGPQPVQPPGVRAVVGLVVPRHRGRRGVSHRRSPLRRAPRPRCGAPARCRAGSAHPRRGVVSSQRVVRQRMSMSGWWFICSASSATASTIRMAAGKSGASTVATMASPSRCHPLSPASCVVTSSSPRSRLMGTIVVHRRMPCGTGAPRSRDP